MPLTRTIGKKGGMANQKTLVIVGCLWSQKWLTVLVALSDKEAKKDGCGQGC